jgi:hypothetical protein
MRPLDRLPEVVVPDILDLAGRVESIDGTLTICEFGSVRSVLVESFSEEGVEGCIALLQVLVLEVSGVYESEKEQLTCCRIDSMLSATACFSLSAASCFSASPASTRD